jgi:large subunit ribosomal protein L30
MAGTIKIKLVRSPICTPEKHKVIVRALGLKKINQVVERPDTPAFRGMVKKVPHLLELAPAELRAKGTPRGAAK